MQPLDLVVRRTDVAHWLDLWKRLNLGGDPEAWHARLMAAYGEPHRHYHTSEHLAECLTVFDRLRALATKPQLVEFALWFHDAVYDPRAADNEERSSDLARSCLTAAGISAEHVQHVEDLILATKSHRPTSTDGQLVCDADLAIFSQPPERYWRYEDDIAQEYSWVGREVFRLKRSEILEQFLARETIYHTAQAHDSFEQQARINLAAALARLRSATT
jgi:predicted metal-dependent HD superfamily phosphohydrolase